jgi:predicted phosphodiesterase
MRCAVISDIHANRAALVATLKSIKDANVDLILNAGDTFGYYAWPMEVYDLLRPLPVKSVLGNHDRMVLGGKCQIPFPFYWPIIEHNRGALTPAAWQWLGALPVEFHVQCGNVSVHMLHGTPDDPLEGRLYPDRPLDGIPWLPKHREVLILGHTHYPVIAHTASGGLLVNPGSVGQPRDDDPRSAWALIDTEIFTASVIRVDYDRRQTTQDLRQLNWPDQAIWALNKTAA